MLLGILAVVGWILLAPVPEREEQAGPGGALPGEGPLLVEMRWRGGEQDDRIQQSRPGRMGGQVLDAAGQPAPAVRMRVVGGPQDGAETVTGPDGRYLFQDLVPGTHFFALQQPGGPPVVRLQRISSRRLTQRDFQLGAVMEVPFKVVDHQDKPIAGATVAPDLGEHQGVSGEDGVAWVAGVAGGLRVLVEVRAESYVPVRYEMNLYAPLLTGDPIVLPPLPSGGTVISPSTPGSSRSPGRGRQPGSCGRMSRSTRAGSSR